MHLTNATNAAAYSLISDSDTLELDFVSGALAISRALHERGFHGRQADVCGPTGWVLVDGKFVGEGADWEVFDIEYSPRSGFQFSGFNRCTGETFTWLGCDYDARFGFKHARVVDEIALRFMRVRGWDV